MTTTNSDGEETRFGVRRTRYEARATGLSKERAAGIAGSLYDVAASQPAGADSKELSPRGRAALRSAVGLIAGLVSRVEARETLEDIAIQAPGLGNATLRAMQMGFGGDAAGGLLHVWTDIALNGLAADAMPPQFVRYVPSRIAFRPALSGLPVDGVMALLQEAAKEGADEDRLKAQSMALLGGKDVSLGLELLQIEMDPLRIDGAGTIKLLPNGKPGMMARLTATGLDAMMAEASKDPALAQIMPFVVMARGLGRAEADRLVWDIAVTEAGTLVNGMDVAAMGGPPPAQRKPKR